MINNNTVVKSLVASIALASLGFGMSASAAVIPTPSEAQLTAAQSASSTSIGTQFANMRQVPATDKVAPSVEIPTRPPMQENPGMRITVESFLVTGNSVFDDFELTTLLQDVVGKEVNFYELQQAVSRISDHYRDQGYVVARAYLPRQTIRDNVVEIAVMEGIVGKVNAQYNKLRGFLVDGYLAGLANSGVIHTDNLDRSLLLLDDLPGVSVKASLKPGTSRGETDIDVAINEDKHFSGYIHANNYGSRFSGENQIGLGLRFDNFFGFGESFGVRGSVSEGKDSTYGGFDFSMPVGKWGTRAGLGYARLDNVIGKEFKILGLESETTLWNAYVVHPIIRSRDKNLFLQLSYEDKETDQTADEGGVGLESEDDLRVARLTMSGDSRDQLFSGGINAYSLSYSRGLGGSSRGEFIQSNDDFSAVAMDVSRLQRVTDNGSLYFRVAAQYTNESLPSTEGFSLGGPRGVRAFISGEGLADEGVIGTMEYRYNMNFESRFIESFQPFIFIDAGKSNFNDELAAENRAQHHSNAGLGLKMALKGGYFVEVSFAHRLDESRDIETDEEAEKELFFQLVKWF